MHIIDTSIKLFLICNIVFNWESLSVTACRLQQSDAPHPGPATVANKNNNIPVTSGSLNNEYTLNDLVKCR